jgi:hypothetical protein
LLPIASLDLPGKAEMNQIKIRPNLVDINFNEVAAIADRMVWTGKLPTLSAICRELKVRNVDKARQYFELWRAGYSRNWPEKTHIADLPPELQHLMAEAFERGVTGLRTKLNAECAKLRVERDRLKKVVEQQSADIKALTVALGDAEAKIGEQARQITRLKNEIDGQRDAHTRTEQRIHEAM